MIKINDTKHFNKILTSPGIEQLSPIPLTLTEDIKLVKSADSLFCKVYLNEQTATSATLDRIISVPVGETWRILGMSILCTTQAITDLVFSLRAQNDSSGVVVNCRWSETASLAAGVGFQNTSMGSSGVVLNTGDGVRFQGTPAASAQILTWVIYQKAPAGFATQ